MKFNVIWLDISTNKMMEYDIIPHLKRCYNIKKKNERPKTFDEFKSFIISESRYQWWARCEYEIIISSWPTGMCEEKWDIHDQVMMNIDLITELFMKEVL
jgi:hypothetical protein